MERLVTRSGTVLLGQGDDLSATDSNNAATVNLVLLPSVLHVEYQQVPKKAFQAT